MDQDFGTFVDIAWDDPAYAVDPRGFIGTNKSCAQDTVAKLLDDLDAGVAQRTSAPTPALLH